jgi:hypothetical protein
MTLLFTVTFQYHSMRTIGKYPTCDTTKYSGYWKTVREFAAHQRELNNYLLFFPRQKAPNTAPLKLKDAELVEILPLG